MIEELARQLLNTAETFKQYMYMYIDNIIVHASMYNCMYIYIYYIRLINVIVHNKEVHCACNKCRPIQTILCKNYVSLEEQLKI